MKKPLAPLTAVLKTKDLQLVQECELTGWENFPDIIERTIIKNTTPVQFVRIGITDRKGFYREGTSYRISQ